MNAARRDVLDLPPLPVREQYGTLGRRRVPLLYGFSPATFTPTEQGDWVDVTGYWFDDRHEHWEPPPALAAFLAEGPPPVFVGFSSMSDRNPEATLAVVSEALARAGQRGIVQWSLVTQNAELPREVFAIDSIPHDWIFRRVTLAVHHGGSGTTGEAFRAGLPSVVVPAAFADHPFWARRVHDLGVGPPRSRASDSRSNGWRMLSMSQQPIRRSANARWRSGSRSDRRTGLPGPSKRSSANRRRCGRYRLPARATNVDPAFDEV